MQKGFKFINGNIEYTVLDYAVTKHGDIALLKRDTYCPFVVARVLQPQPDGRFIWAWGNYFTERCNAEEYFRTRTAELQ